jgi:hypothetical protein
MPRSRAKDDKSTDGARKWSPPPPSEKCNCENTELLEFLNESLIAKTTKRTSRRLVFWE